MMDCCTAVRTELLKIRCSSPRSRCMLLRRGRSSRARSRKYTAMHTADRPWASTVAQAAPPTPMPKRRMNTRSSTMLVTADTARKRRGMAVSPMLRSTAARKL